MQPPPNPNPNPPGPQTLVLDPAILQAIRDLTDATKKAAAQQKTQNQYQQVANQHQFRALNTSGIQQTYSLEALHRLQMGQAMGQQLWRNPINGEMHWVPGRGGGAGLGGWAGGGGAGGGGAGGGIGGGWAGGGIGAMLGKVPALQALLTLHTAGQAIATGSEIAYDRYSKGFQDERKFFRDVMPFGGTIQDWVDSISGRKQEFVEARKAGEITAERGALRNEKLTSSIGLAPMTAGNTALAAAYRKQSPALHPVIDRGTAGGEQAYKDAARLLPLKQETLRTEREMKKAVAERTAAEQKVIETGQRQADLERSIAEWRKKRDAATNGVDFEHASQRIQALTKTQEAMRGVGADAERTLYEKRMQAGVATTAHEKAKILEDMLGRAELLEDKAERAKSGAIRLGMMNPLERAQAAQAALIGKQYGVDALPPEMKQMFAQLAPKEFEAAAMKAGQESGAYADLQKAGLVDFPGASRKLFGADIGKRDYASYQKEADQLRHDAGQKEFDAEKAGAQVGQQAGERLALVISAAFDKAIERVEARIEDKLRGARNQ